MMQYLIHDIVALPLEDRLSVIEEAIKSFEDADYLNKVESLIDVAIKRQLAK